MTWSRTLKISPQKFDNLTSTYGQILSYARHGSDLENFIFNFLCVKFYYGHFEAYSRWITLKNKVFRPFLVILVHVIKNVLYATLTSPLGVELRSKKINGHHIIRQNLTENPKKITVLYLGNFNFWPNTVLRKNDS